VLAAAALANVGPEAFTALKDLTAALHDTEPNVRRNAALAIGRMKGVAVSALPDLAGLIIDPKAQPDDVRLYATEAIAYIGHEAHEKLPTFLPELERVISKDPAWQVRQRAVWALGGLEDIEKAGVVPVLESILDETERDTRLVRYEAAVLLGMRLGPKAPPKTTDVLVANLKDESIRVYGGSGTDVKGGGKEVTGEQKVVVRSEGDARWLPAIALGNIGPKANRADVIEALKDAQGSKDAKVREAATEALKKITSK